MATILENMARRQAQLAKDPNATDANVAAAIAAMHDGIGSNAWQEYMTQFATDENNSLDTDQLSRLTGEDGSAGNPKLDRKRCYMVGNSVCGMTTNDKMLYGVNSIDDGVGGKQCNLNLSPCQAENA